MIVIDLIKGDLKEWEVNMLENIFVQEDISMIVVQPEVKPPMVIRFAGAL